MTISSIPQKMGFVMAAVKGYKFIIVISERMSQKKVEHTSVQFRKQTDFCFVA